MFEAILFLVKHQCTNSYDGLLYMCEKLTTFTRSHLYMRQQQIIAFINNVGHFYYVYTYLKFDLKITKCCQSLFFCNIKELSICLNMFTMLICPRIFSSQIAQKTYRHDQSKRRFKQLSTFFSDQHLFLLFGSFVTRNFATPSYQ